MNIIIRRATEGDYMAICRLTVNELGYACEPNKIQDRLKYILQKKGNMVFVAQVDVTVVGYVHTGDYECIHFDSLKNILALAVDCNYRGMGVGRQLLAAAEQWAVEDGSIGVRLVSSFPREGAHKFYLACGYTDRKDQKNFIKLF